MVVLHFLWNLLDSVFDIATKYIVFTEHLISDLEKKPYYSLQPLQCSQEKQKVYTLKKEK